MFYSPRKKLAIFRAALWGATQCGKTETLKGLISQLPREVTRGNWLDYADMPERDTELLLEYVPVRLGRIKEADVMLELFAPHADQAGLEVWQKLVSGADGIIIVVDSRTSRLARNLASLRRLRQLLVTANRSLERTPTVCEFNKRDAPDALPLEVLERAIDLRTAPVVGTVATRQMGLVDVVQALSKLLVRTL